MPNVIGATVFLWAFGEATIFPLPPEVLLIPLVTVLPRSWGLLCSIALLGSLAGGVWSFLAAKWESKKSLSQLRNRIGVVPGMVTKAEHWISKYQTKAVLFSAWTGIPYKIFANLSGATNQHFGRFLMTSILARGSRLLVIGWITQILVIRWHDAIWAQRLWLLFFYVLFVGLGYEWNQRVYKKRITTKGRFPYGIV